MRSDYDDIHVPRQMSRQTCQETVTSCTDLAHNVWVFKNKSCLVYYLKIKCHNQRLLFWLLNTLLNLHNSQSVSSPVLIFCNLSYCMSFNWYQNSSSQACSIVKWLRLATSRHVMNTGTINVRLGYHCLEARGMCTVKLSCFDPSKSSPFFY